MSQALGAGPDDRVIIAGAGPVGLILALKLVQAAVPVTLFEATSADEFATQMERAGSNHPVTLEMYAEPGLYERLEARGLIATKFQYWDRQRAKIIAEFDHDVIKDATAFPFVLQCERLKVCEEALRMVAQHPLCDLRMGEALAGFTQDADFATVRTERKDGGEARMRGRFLVGAEGARSVVRKGLDIAFEGFTYPDADKLLDLYERQRRTIALEYIQAQTIRNKKLLTETDPAVRRRNHDEPRRTAEDRRLAREFLLRASMIKSLQQANAIT